MSKRGASAGEPSTPSRRTSSEARPLWVWLDAAPAAWLALVASAYALLTLIDLVPTKRPVPGIPEADRLVLPFMALTVGAGIIRYFCLRAFERNANSPSASPDLGRRDIA